MLKIAVFIGHSSTIFITLYITHNMHKSQVGDFNAKPRVRTVFWVKKEG